MFMLCVQVCVCVSDFGEQNKEKDQRTQKVEGVIFRSLVSSS